MDTKIGRLVTDIKMASLQPTGSRGTSIIASHAVGAIVKGGALGLFVGFFMNFLLPTSVAVFVGLVVAVGHAITYLSDPGKKQARLSAYCDDSFDKSRRRNAPRNVEELQTLRQARCALKDRLQELNGQVAAARAIVDLQGG